MSLRTVGYFRINTKNISTNDYDVTFIDDCKINDEKPKLQECLEFVKKGDIVYFECFSAITNKLSELRTILNTLMDKGVIIHFTRENLFLTDKTFLEILDNFIDFERDIIKESKNFLIDKDFQNYFYL